MALNETPNEKVCRQGIRIQVDQPGPDQPGCLYSTYQHNKGRLKITFSNIFPTLGWKLLYFFMSTCFNTYQSYICLPKFIHRSFGRFFHLYT